MDTADRPEPLRSLWPRLSFRGKVWVVITGFCLASWAGIIGWMLWLVGAAPW